MLVTGAGGQVGRAATAVFAARGDEVLACDRAALDVTDRAAVARRCADFRPDLVVHAAAWTDVDGAEADEAGALRPTPRPWPRGRAPRGRSTRAWWPSPPTTSSTARRPTATWSPTPSGPLSAYGRTKLAGEWAARAEHPDGPYLVRTAWVYDAEGRELRAHDAARGARARRGLGGLHVRGGAGSQLRASTRWSKKHRKSGAWKSN